jgi:hypothetical protein
MLNDAQAQPASPSGDPEIDRLKERLAFYESFDQLIQSNVSQAGSLLREAIDLRESASASTDSARRQIETERNEDRERYRALFSAMLDEITTLQGQAERLARRLTDAIDKLESELGPGEEFPPLPSSLTAELAGENSPRDDDRQALEDDEFAGSLSGVRTTDTVAPVALGSGAKNQDAAIHEVPEPPVPDSPDDPAPRLDDTVPAEPDDQPATPPSDAGEVPLDDQNALGLDDTIVDTVPEPKQEPPDVIEETVQPSPAGNSAGGQFVLLVHGVPKAATALSLKRHLEALEPVQVVEPREFAAGVLRLQLQVSRDIGSEDLDQWRDNGGFRTIHSRSGLLEIQLLT